MTRKTRVSRLIDCYCLPTFPCIHWNCRGVSRESWGAREHPPPLCKVPIVPKNVFRLNFFCVFVSKMVKELSFLLENSIFYAPSKSQKITEKICTTELVRGLGLFLGWCHRIIYLALSPYKYQKLRNLANSICVCFKVSPLQKKKLGLGALLVSHFFNPLPPMSDL